MKKTSRSWNSTLRKTTPKTANRNARWKAIVIGRALYLARKYGKIVCEYSGETIKCLTSVADDMNDGWGHHLNGKRADCVPENCYIVKYKYHRLIHDNNITVRQEDFQGVKHE